MSVKIHLEGDGLLYDDETSVFNAAQIIGFLKNNDALAAGPQGNSQSAVIGLAKPRISPREALINSRAKTNPQKITVLGHYLMSQNGHDSFGLDEIRFAFKKAGEPLPKNFSRDVKEAVTSMLIYEEATDEYVLTESALEYIESGFPETTKKSKLSKRTGIRKNGSSSRIALNQVLLDKLSANGNSLKEYISQRQQVYSKRASDQTAIIATWLMDEMKMDSMAPSDLQAVRRYLGEPTGNAHSQINNAMARDGYFSNVKEGRYFLSSKGQDLARIHSVNAGD